MAYSGWDFFKDPIFLSKIYVFFPHACGARGQFWLCAKLSSEYT